MQIVPFRNYLDPVSSLYHTAARLARRAMPALRRRALHILASVLLAAPVAVGAGPAVGALAAQPGTLTGTLVVMWGDGPPGSNIALPPVYVLVDSSGASTNLEISPALAEAAGGPTALSGQQVVVTVDPVAGATAAGSVVAQAVQVVPPSGPAPAAAGAAGVTGSQPWISIMCKFSDVSSEPKNLAYFQGMYSSSAPGMDHYWREQSFDLVNVAGSGAVGWYTLPQPKSYYVYGSPAHLDFSRAANDCTAQADAAVYFPSYVGINLMFNAELDGYAWGGSYVLSRDGTSKLYRMTWEPPWGYSNVAVIAHEMGHGFGLPHSSGPYGLVYDNRWDVMSDTWSGCSGAAYSATYGCLGQHTISYHKDILGWIASAKRYVATAGSEATITLERLALPQTANYLMAKIPISGSSSHYYTVEVRQKAGYDVKLPSPSGTAPVVIIHEVNTAWPEDAHVLDPDGNGNTGDAGAMWVAGETFSNAAYGVKVCVLQATSTGYVVTIGLGAGTTCVTAPVSFPYNIFVPFVLE